MEQQEKIFDGAEIGEKKFPFKELSINASAKIVRRLIMTRNPIVFFYRGIRNVFSRSTVKKRQWLAVRSVAFERYGLWKIGIVPKELRCSIIKQEAAEKAQQDFFDFAKGILREHVGHLRFSIPSLTENRKKD